MMMLILMMMAMRACSVIVRLVIAVSAINSTKRTCTIETIVPTHIRIINFPGPHGQLLCAASNKISGPNTVVFSDCSSLLN